MGQGTPRRRPVPRSSGIVVETGPERPALVSSEGTSSPRRRARTPGSGAATTASCSRTHGTSRGEADPRNASVTCQFSRGTHRAGGRPHATDFDRSLDDVRGPAGDRDGDEEAVRLVSGSPTISRCHGRRSRLRRCGRRRAATHPRGSAARGRAPPGSAHRRTRASHPMPRTRGRAGNAVRVEADPHRPGLRPVMWFGTSAPVSETATSASYRRRAPAAISSAHSRLTTPGPSIVSRGHAEDPLLRLRPCTRPPTRRRPSMRLRRRSKGKPRRWAPRERLGTSETSAWTPAGDATPGFSSVSSSSVKTRSPRRRCTSAASGAIIDSACSTVSAFAVEPHLDLARRSQIGEARVRRRREEVCQHLRDLPFHEAHAPEGAGSHHGRPDRGAELRQHRAPHHRDHLCRDPRQRVDPHAAR